jgi:hypothetical protein
MTTQSTRSKSIAASLTIGEAANQPDGDTLMQDEITWWDSEKALDIFGLYKPEMHMYRWIQFTLPEFESICATNPTLRDDLNSPGFLYDPEGTGSNTQPHRVPC